MTPVQRVRRARAVLGGATLVTAGLWGLAAALGGLALVAVLSLIALPPAATRLLASSLPLWRVGVAIVALGTIVTMLWRMRAVWSLESVALWLEEHAPALQYALVTVVDGADHRSTRYHSASRRTATDWQPALVAAAGGVNVEGIVRRATTRMLMWAILAVSVAGVTAQLLQASGSIDRLGHIRKPRAIIPPLGNRLKHLRAEVIPPAYTGLPRRLISDPTTVTAVYGTQIRFQGDGLPNGVAAIVDRDTVIKDTLSAQASGSNWALQVPMPRLPGLIRFQDRSPDRMYHRSVLLEPLLDSVPQVALRSPAVDTTWRWDRPPQGDLILEADIRDDYGVRSAFFEILVSTGGAENFETKDRSTPRVQFAGSRHVTLRTTVRYAALGVAPGTVLHVRAIAYDNNTVADSAGKGVSETRTLRVATKEETDTTSVKAADPLPVDSLWMGQRQLNARTDTLIRVRQPKIPHTQYVDTSIAYADRQELIRGRVENLIILLEDDGVGGRQETESSRLLRQASEQMWEARQELAIGQPDSAYVPAKSPMKEALRLLEAARKAQKYYLRGVLQPRPVNIVEERLQGVDSGNAADRMARTIPEELRRALRRQLMAVVPFAVAAPQDAVDSLLLIRATALRGGAPTVASALQEAIDAAHRGQSPGAPLTRAQRLLDPPPQRTAGPAEWGGVLP